MAHGLSCSVACGIFWDQGLNLSLLNWQANSLPLSHEGSPNLFLGFSGGASGKEPEGQSRRRKRRGFDPLVGKIPWRRAWQPTPVSLLGEFHAQKSLAGYSPQGHKESGPTEHVCMAVHACTHTHTHIQGFQHHLIFHLARGILLL